MENKDKLFILSPDIDSVDDLDLWMKQFKFLTYHQRKLSNDASIAQYGENNYTRYNKMRKVLLGFNTEKIEDDTEDDTVSSETISESSTYSSNIDIENIINNVDNEQWEIMIIKARNAESIGMVIMIDTTSTKKINIYSFDEMDRLEKKWRTLQSLSSNRRIESNQIAHAIFGIDNDNLYTSIKNYVYNRIEHMVAFDYDDNNFDDFEFRNTVDFEVDEPLAKSIREALIEDELKDCTLVDKVNLETVYDIDKNKLREEKPSIPVPFFSPEEMINFGVFSGEINIYSPTPDNDVVGDRPVYEWFRKYQLVGELSESERYLWIKKLNELYVDYDKIIREGDIDKINSRKQSILELGWNPEIPFTQQAAIKANLRNCSVRENCNIDLKSYYENESGEKPSVNLQDSKPIFLLFNKNISGNKSVILATNILNDEAHLFQNNTYSHISLSDYTMDGEYIISAVFLDNTTWNNLQIVLQDTESHKNEFEAIKGKFYEALNIGNGVTQICNALLNLFSYPRGNYIYHLYDGKCSDVDTNKILNMVNAITTPADSITQSNESLREVMVNGNYTISKLRASSKDLKNITNIFESAGKVKISVDDKGNLRIRNITDINNEFFKSHRNLLAYEKAGNIASMKDELCKLKFLDNIAVNRMKNRDNKDYKEYADAHARIVNDFTKYLKIVTDFEPDFNFVEYYKDSEWYDGEVVISKNLMQWLLDIMTKILIK